MLHAILTRAVNWTCHPAQAHNRQQYIAPAQACRGDIIQILLRLINGLPLHHSLRGTTGASNQARTLCGAICSHAEVEWSAFVSKRNIWHPSRPDQTRRHTHSTARTHNSLPQAMYMRSTRTAEAAQPVVLALALTPAPALCPNPVLGLVGGVCLPLVET